MRLTALLAAHGSAGCRLPECACVFWCFCHTRLLCLSLWLQRSWGASEFFISSMSHMSILKRLSLSTKIHFFGVGHFYPIVYCLAGVVIIVKEALKIKLKPPVRVQCKLSLLWLLQQLNRPCAIIYQQRLNVIKPRGKVLQDWQECLETKYTLHLQSWILLSQSEGSFEFTFYWELSK